MSVTSAQAVARAAAGMSAVVLGFLALASSAYCADSTMPPEAARVTVVNPKRECFSATVRVSGFLVPRMEGVVRLDPDGSRITEVLVGKGDVVTAGQVMARFARPTIDTGGEAGPRPGAGAPGDLAARAAANPPGTPPNPTAAPTSNNPIRAPFAGTVLESTASVGATASPFGEPLFRIAADGEIEVEAEIPSIHVLMLAPGQTARVEVEDDRELNGQVRLVFVEINPITQMGRARIAVNGEALVAGKFVRATIDVKRSCGIVIPRSAISYRTAGTSVQVVRDGTIETRNVRVGLRSGRNAEIQEGLAESDVVVANAGTSLRDGDTVNPVFRDKPE
jgi:multidrug efflux pump subunit AcrA (membrane-fusion protein)